MKKKKTQLFMEAQFKKKTPLIFGKITNFQTIEKTLKIGPFGFSAMVTLGIEKAPFFCPTLQ